MRESYQNLSAHARRGYGSASHGKRSYSLSFPNRARANGKAEIRNSNPGAPGQTRNWKIEFEASNLIRHSSFEFRISHFPSPRFLLQGRLRDRRSVTSSNREKPQSISECLIPPPGGADAAISQVGSMSGKVRFCPGFEKFSFSSPARSAGEGR